MQIRHVYENGIAAVKKDLKDEYIDTCKPVPQYSHDATLIYIVENKRRNNAKEGKDLDRQYEMTPPVVKRGFACHT